MSKNWRKKAAGLLSVLIVAGMPASMPSAIVAGAAENTVATVQSEENQTLSYKLTVFDKNTRLDDDKIPTDYIHWDRRIDFSGNTEAHIKDADKAWSFVKVKIYDIWGNPENPREEYKPEYYKCGLVDATLENSYNYSRIYLIDESEYEEIINSNKTFEIIETNGKYTLRELPHEHDYNVEVNDDGSKLVNTCKNDGCPNEDVVLAEITMDNFTYDAEVHDSVTTTSGQNIQVGKTVIQRDGEKVTEIRDAGEYTITQKVTYGGTEYTLEKSFTVSPKSVKDINIVRILDGNKIDGSACETEYNNNEHTFEVEVEPFNGDEVTYDVVDGSISKATESSEYSYVIEGTGNYCDIRMIYWSIIPADRKFDIYADGVLADNTTVIKKTYNGEPISIEVKDADDTVIEDAKLTYFDSDNNELAEAPVDAGVYYVTAVVEGSGNYNTYSNTISFTIEKAKATITPENTSVVYGSAKDADINYGYTTEGFIGDDAEFLSEFSGSDLFTAENYDSNKGVVGKYEIVGKPIVKKEADSDSSEPLAEIFSMTNIGQCSYDKVFPVRLLINGVPEDYYCGMKKNYAYLFSKNEVSVDGVNVTSKQSPYGMFNYYYSNIELELSEGETYSLTPADNDSGNLYLYSTEVEDKDDVMPFEVNVVVIERCMDSVVLVHQVSETTINGKPYKVIYTEVPSEIYLVPMEGYDIEISDIANVASWCPKADYDEDYLKIEGFCELSEYKEYTLTVADDGSGTLTGVPSCEVALPAEITKNYDVTLGDGATLTVTPFNIKKNDGNRVFANYTSTFTYNQDIHGPIFNLISLYDNNVWGEENCIELPITVAGQTYKTEVGSYIAQVAANSDNYTGYMNLNWEIVEGDIFLDGYYVNGIEYGEELVYEIGADDLPAGAEVTYEFFKTPEQTADNSSDSESTVVEKETVSESGIISYVSNNSDGTVNSNAEINLDELESLGSTPPVNVGSYMVAATISAKGYETLRISSKFDIFQRLIMVELPELEITYGDKLPETVIPSVMENVEGVGINGIVGDDEVEITGKNLKAKPISMAPVIIPTPGSSFSDTSMVIFEYSSPFTSGLSSISNITESVQNAANEVLELRAGKYKYDCDFEVSNPNYRVMTYSADGTGYGGNLKVNPKEITPEMVSLAENRIKATGNIVNIEVKSDVLKYSDYEVTEDVDAFGAGKYEAVVIGKGNYTGKVVLPWEVYEGVNVTVKNGTFKDGTTEGAFEQNTVLTIKADAPAEGMKFAYWKKNGVTVSYNTSYSFYVPSRDAEFEAVYVPADDNFEKLAAAKVETVAPSKTDATISFVSVMNVPTDCTILTAGVVATNNEEISATLSVDDKGKQNVYVKEKTGITAHTYKYTWTKSNVADSEYWYVKAYVTYTDANNNVKTVYSDMVKANLEGYETIEEEKIVGTAIIDDVIVDKENGQISFVAIENVPADCKIINGGLLSTLKAENADNLIETTAEYAKIKDGITAHTYKYTWTKTKLEAGQKVYARAYLVYEDAKGKQHTVYGELVTAEMK